MIPARLKTWIFVWTPIVWLVLELITYPKDRPSSSGIVHVLAGSSPRQSPTTRPGSRSSWRSVFVIYGIVKLVRQAKPSPFPWVLLAAGVEAAVWTAVAGGLLHGHFSLTGRSGDFGWLFQAALIVLLAASVWTWGAANPERAELTVWNTRQIWRLYRSNWQGMLGLYIMVFFVAMALLAPFLANHALLDPTAQIGPPFAPPTPPTTTGSAPTSRACRCSPSSSGAPASRSPSVLFATVISTILGAGIGIGAGYYGGWIGEVLMRLTDVFLVIPWLPLAMVLAAAWGQNYWIIVLIIGITSWPGTARVVRADALRVRELQFIERARAIGSSNWHIMQKHILPNVFPLIFANTILVVAIAILSETTLSFLGPRRPAQLQLGHHAPLRLGLGRRRPAGLVVPDAAGHRHRVRRARLHVHGHGLRRGARSQAAQARRGRRAARRRQDRCSGDTDRSHRRRCDSRRRHRRWTGRCHMSTADGSRSRSARTGATHRARRHPRRAQSQGVLQAASRATSRPSTT